MKNEKGKWGYFTKKQRAVLPTHLAYLGLLLYRYDDVTRCNLHDFQWYIYDEGTTMSSFEGYFKRNDFPYLLGAERIIRDIGYGAIGTDNDEILDRIIVPTKNPSLTIVIS